MWLLTSCLPVPFLYCCKKTQPPKFKSFETKTMIYFDHKSAILAGITLLPNVWGPRLGLKPLGTSWASLFPCIFLHKAFSFLTTWQLQSSQSSYKVPRDPDGSCKASSDQAPECPEHHIYHILLVKPVTKSRFQVRDRLHLSWAE